MHTLKGVGDPFLGRALQCWSLGRSTLRSAAHASFSFVAAHTPMYRDVHTHAMQLCDPFSFSRPSPAVLESLDTYPEERRTRLLVRANIEYGIMGYSYQDIAREMVCAPVCVRGWWVCVRACACACWRVWCILVPTFCLAKA